MAANPMMEERGSTEKTGGMSCPDPMDRIKKTTSTAFMPDGFSWPAAAEACEAKRPGWLPFLSIGQVLPMVGHFSTTVYLKNQSSVKHKSVKEARHPRFW
jgi:hypothetical protein